MSNRTESDHVGQPPGTYSVRMVLETSRNQVANVGTRTPRSLGNEYTDNATGSCHAVQVRSHHGKEHRFPHVLDQRRHVRSIQGILPSQCPYGPGLQNPRGVRTFRPDRVNCSHGPGATQVLDQTPRRPPGTPGGVVMRSSVRWVNPHSAGSPRATVASSAQRDRLVGTIWTPIR